MPLPCHTLRAPVQGGIWDGGGAEWELSSLSISKGENSLVPVTEDDAVGLLVHFCKIVTSGLHIIGCR